MVQSSFLRSFELLSKCLGRVSKLSLGRIWRHDLQRLRAAVGMARSDLSRPGYGGIRRKLV